MRLGQAFIEVVPDTSKFGPELNRQVTGSARDVQKQLAGVFAGGAFLVGAKKAIDATSDLNEAVNVTGLTFGAAEGKIADFAKTAAREIGQSERAARSAAASFGGLLLNLGFTEDAAADTSISLTRLASDLASAFNTDPADAILAIGSALRGESEPIQRYNVLLSDQAVRQEAVRLKLAETTAGVDDNAKVQARLSLIMEQTSRVQGDFANTSTDAANAQRINSALNEEAAASMGQSLLPIYEKAVQVVSAATEEFSKLPGPVQTGVVAIAGIVALSGPVLSAGSAIKSLATIARDQLASGLSAAKVEGASLRDTLRGVDGATLGTKTRMIGMLGSIALLIEGSRILNDQFSHLDRADLSQLENSLLDLADTGAASGEAARIFGDDLGDLAGAIERISAPSTLSQTQNAIDEISNLGGLLGNDDSALQRATQAVDDLDAALAQLAGRNPEEAARVLDTIEAGLSPDAAERLPGLLTNYSAALADLDTAHRVAGDSAGGAGDDIEELGDKLSVTDQAAKNTAESVTLFREAVDRALRPLDLQAAQDQRTQAFLDLVEDVEARTQAVLDARRQLADLRAVPVADRDTDAITQAERDLQDAIDDTSLALDGETEAALRNRDVLDELVRNGIEVIETARDQGRSLEDLELIRINERESLRETLRQLGFNEQAVEEYVAILDAIPLTRATTVSVETEEALLRIKDLAAALSAIGQDNIDAAQIDKFLIRAQTQDRAAGGSVMDGLFLVGEGGQPELLHKSGSSVNVIAGSPTALFDGVGEDQLLVQRQLLEVMLRIDGKLSRSSGVEGMRAVQLELT